MRFDYLPYIVTEAFCILYSLIMLFRLQYGLGSDREVRILRFMFVLFIVMLAGDIFWALTEDDVVWLPRRLNALLNAASNISLCGGCFCWYQFVAERSGLAFRRSRTWHVVLSLPLLAITVLNLLSVDYGLVFTIDAEGHYHETELIWAQGGVEYLYVALATALSIRGVIRARTRQEGSEYLMYALFLLASVAAGYFESIYQNVPIVAFVTLLAMLMLFLSIYVDREKRILEQREQLTQSRMAIMLSQIQPHFLFNALSAIQNLCHDGSPEAEEATVAFSQFLRGNLDSLTATMPVPFEKELNHTRNYLTLEHKRFGDNLRVEYDIQTTGFLLPALSLQPIVENAVQHGITQRSGGGTVRISTRETDEVYTVTVADDGVGFDVNALPQDGRSHIGLSNVRERLRIMCGGSLTVTSTPGQGTVAVIEIPRESVPG